ncbi:MAG: S-formylglutathione hydrolase [Alphaproteobacteria bacterium]
MTPISHNKMFGGDQFVYEHDSPACGCPMRVGVFVPPQAADAHCPAVIFLSGLTCTEQNFVTKAGAQKLAAELGIVLIAPDTSPRGDHVPDDKESWDFASGAGFYLDATRMPWAKNYKMGTYVRDELTAWIAETLPVDMNRIGLSGHSMGGHGALTLHLKNPDLYKSCSAFAPITNPSNVPWGQKAFTGYLGEGKAAWGAYDATHLVIESPSSATLLIDQGMADNFFAEQLDPSTFLAACEKSGQSVNYRRQEGYDHSYYFIASFMDDHLRHHADILKAL